MRSHHFVGSTLCLIVSVGCLSPSETGIDSQSASASASGGGGSGRPSGQSASTAPGLGLFQPRYSCNTPDQSDDYNQRILDLVNEARLGAGLNAVTWNSTLAAQASEYGCEMIVGNFFDHVNPQTGSTLGDRAREFGYQFLVVGENLAAGQTSPEQAMREWMNSEPHRENILDPRFTELGISIHTGGYYGYYWVQEFGRPLSAGRPSTASPTIDLGTPAGDAP